ncbi:hypothetical protein M011DRAFT_496669 [Sporormia fimetaria CBS 119925]|uniref:Uncharacterized protein n=1 Tax=Sporormia fimetaria CBS 119925 TaxID=1340428 RepID=A0A6A6V1J5_9PLEO|nr:hypothetical protein M011DRAFT_496669 [Sporormia fimetaria CBS 119925]
MLLTLSNPVKAEFEYKTHASSATYAPYKNTRLSPSFTSGSAPSLPASASSTMGTPHRGLPPPSAMTLPDPGRVQPTMATPLGALPPAPTHWQGAEDSMKNWLLAKMEEEKRRQEEEKTRQEDAKTRQESYRLEQRKIEQSMLRESISGGIPPQLVPIIFAGLGGGPLATISAEWVQQYSAQLQAAQQQQQQAVSQSQTSPGLRRETRLLNPVQPPYGGSVLAPANILGSNVQPLQGQTQQAAFSAAPYSAGITSPRARAAQPPAHVGAPTSAPRPPPPSQLPRLTTNEMHIQPPPTAPSSSAQPAQQDSSPSIYFHHWVPPSSQQEKSSSGNPPATPSGKYKASPSNPPRQRAASQASDPEFTSSPKKRKAQGGHPPPPPPTSAPQSNTSPAYSQISSSSTSTPRRGGHTRTRSDVSSRGHEGPMSRRSTLSSEAQRGGFHVQEQRFPQASAGAPAVQRDTVMTDVQHAQAPPQAETRQSGPPQQLSTHGGKVNPLCNPVITTDSHF